MSSGLARRRSGILEPGRVLEEVCRLYQQGESGVLEVHSGGGTRRLFFLDGELHLPPSHPLAGPLADSLAKASANDEPDEGIRLLLQRVATVFAGWDHGSFSFDPGRAAVPPGAVGPLPTAELVVAAAEGGGESLLAVLGGDQARLVARDPGDRVRHRIRLNSLEQLLLGRLQKPRRVSTLLTMGGGGPEAARKALARLKALGFVEVFAAEEGSPGVSQELVGTFRERVQRDLDERPLELSPEEHRSLLADLLGSLGQRNHYELLGVSMGAGAETIHAAYQELARKVHPSHAERLGLAGRDGAVVLLFERATEAYLVLSDPDRRAGYLQEMELTLGVRGQGSGAQGKGDPKARAAGLFKQAQGMVEREEYHYAVEILRQAVYLDAKADYWALLGAAQSHNPKWLRHAAESFRQALLIDPDNPAYRLEMARVFEGMGQHARALSAYRSILVRIPDQADAVAAIARLQQSGMGRVLSSLKPPAGGHEGGKPGFLARLFGRR